MHVFDDPWQVRWGHGILAHISCYNCRSEVEQCSAARRGSGAPVIGIQILSIVRDQSRRTARGPARSTTSLIAPPAGQMVVKLTDTKRGLQFKLGSASFQSGAEGRHDRGAG